MPWKPVASGTIEYVVYKFVSHWKGWTIAIGLGLLLLAGSSEDKKKNDPATTPVQYQLPR